MLHRLARSVPRKLRKHTQRLRWTLSFHMRMWSSALIEPWEREVSRLIEEEKWGEAQYLIRQTQANLGYPGNLHPDFAYYETFVSMSRAGL